jgi:hypothetical protein
MVIPGVWNGEPVSLSARPGALTVSIGNPLQADVFSYDGAGRMWTAYINGVSYRRGLDGKIVARWRAAEGRIRRWLPRSESLEVEEQARRRIAALLEALDRGEATLSTPLPHKARLLIEKVIAFDAARSAADAARYFEIYKPVGILPPDQYMAVVLQATEGCSFNTCTFCTFYRDRRFRIKTPEEFRAHALAVRDFLGDGLGLRRTIFLGDANALVIPMPRLLPLIDIVHEVYDVNRLGGIYAFLDGFSGEKKSVQDYTALHKRGLARVYVGLESGNADLLAFLKKPGHPDDALHAVRAMKQAGVAVGVVILLGAGGRQHADAHIRDTIRALNAMPLDGSDIIYLSELVISQDMPYAKDAAQAGLRPLTHSECVEQGEAISAGLAWKASTRPRIARYDIREFVY